MHPPPLRSVNKCKPPARPPRMRRPSRTMAAQPKTPHILYFINDEPLKHAEDSSQLHKTGETMNFAPFTGHIAAHGGGLPTIQQFAKLGYDAVPAGSVPVDVKFRQPEVVVVSAAQPAVALAGIAPIHTVNTGVKYQTLSTSVNVGNVGGVAYHGYVEPRDKRDFRDDQELMAMMQQQSSIGVSGAPLQPGAQQLLVVLHEPRGKQDGRLERQPATEFIISCGPGIGEVSDGSWQAIGGGVADYLSALPLPLHHLLKYSAPATAVEGKREEVITVPAGMSAVNTVNVPPNPPNPVQNSVVVQTSTVVNQTNTPSVIVKKRKKKKSVLKEKKPRPKPGEIRLTTALDGSTLYCCPECHMAYPERGLLEQHLLGHTMERRMPKKKQSREERLEKKRIAERKRKEKIKKDPEKAEALRRKERERYLKKIGK